MPTLKQPAQYIRSSLTRSQSDAIFEGVYLFAFKSIGRKHRTE